MLKYNEKNSAEVRVYEYITKRCETDQCLKEKIDSTSKTITGALKYCKGEASKIAAGSSSICIDDEQVFEWVVHYFLEDKLEEKEEPVKKEKPKKESKPVVKKEKPQSANKKDFEQLALF